MNIKLEEAKRDPEIRKLTNDYANKIADAEQFWSYTSSENDVSSAFMEYKKMVHEAEDDLDYGKRMFYCNNSLTNEKFYKDIPNSSVVHKMLKILNDNPNGLPMKDCNELIKPDSQAKSIGCAFGDSWIMTEYKYNWIETKRVEVSPNIPYREIRYVITDEGKKALDAFERYGHVPEVDYDKFIKKSKSDFNNSDFEDIYTSSN